MPRAGPLPSTRHTWRLWLGWAKEWISGQVGGDAPFKVYRLQGGPIHFPNSPVENATSDPLKLSKSLLFKEKI